MEEVTFDLVIKDAFVYKVMGGSAIQAEGAISAKAQRQGSISSHLRGRQRVKLEQQ